MHDYDLTITGARVMDGTGAPARRADLAVSGDRIAVLGRVDGGTAAEHIDGCGLVLAPGFIDAHTHDDRAVLSDPKMTAKVSQGVTSVVAGNCGVSLAPLADTDPVPPMTLLGDRHWYRFPRVDAYMDAVAEAKPSVNIALLCGHTTLRAGTMDSLQRPATAGELERMAARLDEAMDQGCIGLSTGLAYPPAVNAPTEEVIALARRAGAHDGVYATHMRNEREGVVDSVRETLRIGQEASLPVVISHHKCTGRANWGLTRETLELIASARRSQRVNLDVYPYTASSTVLLAEWVPSAEKVLVTWSRSHPEMAGRDLAEIGAAWGVSAQDACERLHPAGAIYFQMDEADLRRVLSFDDAMVGSDGLPHDEFPHPRLWGTFPRVLGHYARDEKLFGLEQAVRRMSAVAADVFGFKDRGVLREGAFADLVLFDPQTVIDAATFSAPTAKSRGIRKVWVNGVLSYDDGDATGGGGGRVLRREP